MEKRKYLHIFEQIKKDILEEKIKNRLPSIRKLSLRYSVNKSTIIKTLEKLKGDGFIYSLPNSGFYIQKDSRFLKEDKNKSYAIDFSNGIPGKEIFPVKDYKECVLKVMNRDGASVFDYEEESGYLPLRKEIVKRLKRMDVEASWENIFVIPGSQIGIDYVARLLLNPGDIVVMEEPSFMGALKSFSDKGTKIITVPLERDGIDLSLLEDILKKNRIKLLYTVPNFQNPTGISMDSKKMKKLISLAEKYNFYILEDDTMSELNFSVKKPRILKSFDRSDKVIYLKSFSKIFNPGFKMGYLLINDELKSTLIQILKNELLLTSALNQRAFHYFLESKKWDTHLFRIRKKFKKNYLRMRDEIMKIENLEMEIDPKGGLYFWIKIKKMEGFLLYTKLLKHELGIIPGNMYSDRYLHHIRISFAKVDEETISKGFNIMKNITKS